MGLFLVEFLYIYYVFIQLRSVELQKRPVFRWGFILLSFCVLRLPGVGGAPIEAPDLRAINCGGHLPSTSGIALQRLRRCVWSCARPFGSGVVTGDLLPLNFLRLSSCGSVKHFSGAIPRLLADRSGLQSLLKDTPLHGTLKWLPEEDLDYLRVASCWAISFFSKPALAVVA